MTFPDKLFSIEQVEGLIGYLKQPSAHIGRAEALCTYQQLLEIMRENERLKKEIAEWEKIGELQIAVNGLRKGVDDISNKHSD